MVSPGAGMRASFGSRAAALFLVLSHLALSVSAALPLELRDSEQEPSQLLQTVLSSDAASTFGRPGTDGGSPADPASGQSKAERISCWQERWNVWSPDSGVSVSNSSMRRYQLLVLDRKAGQQMRIAVVRSGNSDADPPCQTHA